MEKGQEVDYHHEGRVLKARVARVRGGNQVDLDVDGLGLVQFVPIEHDTPAAAPLDIGHRAKPIPPLRLLHVGLVALLTGLAGGAVAELAIHFLTR